MSNPVTQEARRAAFANATEEDADLLNPWIHRRAKRWNADGYAREWREAFIKASREETFRKKQAKDREDTAFLIENGFPRQD